MSNITMPSNVSGRERYVPQSYFLLGLGIGRSAKKGTFTGRIRSVAHTEFDQVGATGQSSNEEVQSRSRVKCVIRKITCTIFLHVGDSYTDTSNCMSTIRGAIQRDALKHLSKCGAYIDDVSLTFMYNAHRGTSRW